MKKYYFAVFIGAGAAGIFAANRCASLSPNKDILLLEQSRAPLSKLSISGGGRCNLTNACFEPRTLARNYPRGNRELIGPFSRFQPSDVIEWFESRGVALKTEAEGRVFPVTDSSQTIIDCLLKEAERHGVSIRYNAKVKKVEPENSSGFIIRLSSQEEIYTQQIMLATGSSAGGYRIAQDLGHAIIPPVPSLFTFNIPHSPLHVLSGLSVEEAEVSLPELNLRQQGALLITHWGFSGPAILKLSAWGARGLHDLRYQTTCSVDWVPQTSENDLRKLLEVKSNGPCKKSILKDQLLEVIPRKLWKTLLMTLEIDTTQNWKTVSKKSKDRLIRRLKYDIYNISGKGTHKQEFVTCGGIPSLEVNFKRMESKKNSGLFFGGELLNIDGITGGFNFQAAWTTGYLAGSAMADG